MTPEQVAHYRRLAQVSAEQHRLLPRRRRFRMAVRTWTVFLAMLVVGVTAVTWFAVQVAIPSMARDVPIKGTDTGPFANCRGTGLDSICTEGTTP